MAELQIRQFERAGLAALSDLEVAEVRQLIDRLDGVQREFLAEESRFRSPGYKWPRDALHWWSRVWEYPYVYHHLRRMREQTPERMTRVADLGSGVTFFPFALARLGFDVCCMDQDPVCETDIARAAAVVPGQPGSVRFRQVQDSRLPAGQEELDAVYCISVLEHIPQFEVTIEEIARVLRPGGQLVLTFDMDCCGHMDIGPRRYGDLRRLLDRHFELLVPETTTHPMDVLDADHSPIPLVPRGRMARGSFWMRQQAKRLLGRKAASRFPNLAIWGGVMAKR